MRESAIAEFSGAKLMIVDDTIENINLLSRMFEVYNLRISVANSGTLALKNVERIRPDLILMDVMMPGINGYETCAAIKKIEGMQNTPVIFVTARTDMDGLAEGFRVGGVDYITKPVQQEEVLARVATHLKIRRLIDSQSTIIRSLQSAFTEDMTGVANMGSGLRGPLSTIMGYADLLMERASNDQQQSYIKPLQAIQSAGHQLLNEINDVIDLARLDSGRLDLYQDDFLVASLQDALSYRLANISSASANQYSMIPCDPHLILHSDHQRIEQILVNLFSHFFNNLTDKTINLELRVSDGRVHFLVYVAEQGLSEERVQQLLDPQYAISHSNFGKFENQLPMSIAQKLAKLLDGQLLSLPFDQDELVFDLSFPQKR